MTDVSNLQAPVQGLHFLYIDSNPNPKVLILIKRHHGTYTLIKASSDINDTHLSQKDDGTQEKQPDAVLVGDVDGVDYQHEIVEAMLQHHINTLIPFSRYRAKNNDLLCLPKEERGSIRFIGFGGEQNEANPLPLFNSGAQDAEKHFLDLEQAIRTPIQTKEGHKRFIDWIDNFRHKERL